MATYTLSGADAEAGRKRALELFPELEKRLDYPARSLSGGEQQMVVLAQALVSHPRFVIIDELSLGLAPVVVNRLIPTIKAIAESGIGVLLIEQFATVALGLANRAYIMEDGRIQFSGQASQLRENPELLQSAYLLRGPTPPPRRVGRVGRWIGAGERRPAVLMTVRGLEHVLVLADDIDVTRDFYRDVVGLSVGDRPPLGLPGVLAVRRLGRPSAASTSPSVVRTPRMPLVWGCRCRSAIRGSDPVDHVAFSAGDWDAVDGPARAIWRARGDECRPGRAAPGVHRGSERGAGRDQRVGP